MRLRWIFAVSLVLLLISGLAFAEIPAPAPRVKLATSDWNFGAILADRIISHIFIIENTGQADLVLSAENTSCQCTTATFIIKDSPKETADDVTVPKGGEARLEVSLDTKNKIGQVQNAVFITTNDPENRVIIINIKAKVKQEETK